MRRRTFKPSVACNASLSCSNLGSDEPCSRGGLRVRFNDDDEVHNGE
jgi:hypothetical protein